MVGHSSLLFRQCRSYLLYLLHEMESAGQEKLRTKKKARNANVNLGKGNSNIGKNKQAITNNALTT